MEHAILMYTVNRYANVITVMLTELYTEQFPYMESANLGLLFPDKYKKMATPPISMLSSIVNEGK